jgi:hypothetical protein
VEPQNFARIRHILLPHEYLNLWLTGEMRAEAGDASLLVHGFRSSDRRNRASAGRGRSSLPWRYDSGIRCVLNRERKMACRFPKQRLGSLP